MPFPKKMFLLLGCLFWAARAAAQIVNIEELRITGTNDSTRWYGSLKAAANLTRIQKQILLLHGEGRVQYRKSGHLGLFLLNSDLIRTEDEDFTNAHFAHLRYTGKITPTFAWEAFAQAQVNRLLLLRHRELLGAGLRLRLLKQFLRKNRAYVGMAIMPEWNEFLNDYPRTHWWRNSNYLSLTFRLPNGTALVGTTYWQPVVGQIKNYRLSTEWALTLPIFKSLAFSSDLTFSRDRALPAAAPPDFFIWKNGVVWQFR